MHFKYNNISPGYLGQPCTYATLNAQFYGLYLNETIVSSQPFIFPQKVPRKGFFEELYNLESSNYKKRFDAVILTIKNNYQIALQGLIENNSEGNARRYINLCNILLRYGCFEHLTNYFPTNYRGYYALEINMVRENAKIELLLSQDRSISIDEQLELFEIFFDDKNTSNREKISLLNQVIVNFCRHIKDHRLNKKIFELSKLFLDLITQFESTDFINMIYCSIGYRGLAMVSEFDTETKNEFLNKAETIARYIQCKSKIEKIIAGDNLITCLQTMSKWSLQNKNIKKAENYFHEMIAIDPYDSMGHSELGFFYSHQEDFGKASARFFKSHEAWATRNRNECLLLC